jgi:hypothetical protein
MKSSLHSLIPFLQPLLNHPTADSRDSLYYYSFGLASSLYSLGRPQQKTSFSNNPFIITYVLVAVGICLPSRCLAMNVYSGSAIPAFRCHVTIYSPLLFRRWGYNIKVGLKEIHWRVLGYLNSGWMLWKL